jgi:hypothetical protein
VCAVLTRKGLTRLSNQHPSVSAVFAPNGKAWSGAGSAGISSKSRLICNLCAAGDVRRLLYWHVHSSLCPPFFSSPNDCLWPQPPVFVYILIKVNLRRRLSWKFSGDLPKLIGHDTHHKAESHSKARLTITDGCLPYHNTPSEDAKGGQYAGDMRQCSRLWCAALSSQQTNSIFN